MSNERTPATQSVNAFDASYLATAELDARFYLDQVMAMVGVDGLVEALAQPFLLAKVDQHAAAVRQSITAAGKAIDSISSPGTPAASSPSTSGTAGRCRPRTASTGRTRTGRCCAWCRSAPSPTQPTRSEDNRKGFSGQPERVLRTTERPARASMFHDPSVAARPGRPARRLRPGLLGEPAPNGDIRPGGNKHKHKRIWYGDSPGLDRSHAEGQRPARPRRPPGAGPGRGARR
ncbi:hypothetical protein GCM10027610_100540 [Dactylosporangium cerinum]